MREREAQELSRLDKLIAAARELAVEVKERVEAVSQNVAEGLEQFRARFDKWREERGEVRRSGRRQKAASPAQSRSPAGRAGAGAGVGDRKASAGVPGALCRPPERAGAGDVPVQQVQPPPSRRWSRNRSKKAAQDQPWLWVEPVGRRRAMSEEQSAGEVMAFGIIEQANRLAKSASITQADPRASRSRS